MNSTFAPVIETLDEQDPRRGQTLRFLLSAPGDTHGQADRRVQGLLAHLAAQDQRVDAIVRASVGGQLLSAAMLIESPGRQGSAFLPGGKLVGPQRQAAVAALTVLREHARARRLTILQSLPTADQRHQCIAYAEAGFEFLAELVYLDRPTAAPCPAFRKLDGLEFVSFSTGVEPLFLEVLASTYQDSRDCPGLTGVRQTEDVLAAHRATGMHDPKHWFVLKLDGQPVGILLLSGIRGRSALEVVYVGVIPEARGRCIGDALLARAVQVCRRNHQAELTLAVDSGNVPALDLYRRWNFGEVDRRQAWIWINPDER